MTPFNPPVVWDAALGGWTVSTYELVTQALRDPGRFASEGSLVAEYLAPKAMLTTDSPVHGAVRGTWAKPFGRPAAAERRQELEGMADEFLAPAIDQLRQGAKVDLVPLFERYAGRVVLSLMNLSRAGEDDFRRWYKLVLNSAAFAITPDHPLYPDHRKAKAEVYAMLAAELEDRRDRPNPNATDLVSLIAGAEGRSGITREVALDNLFNVFTGGADTTVRWLGNAVVVLHRHPDVLAKLRADPSLIPQALEEVMRLRSVTRFAVRTICVDQVELAGEILKRGDAVYLLTSVANHDPQAFEAPERFDLHRSKSRQHLGFSYGMHQCIGMNLARVEAQAFIGRFLATTPELEVIDVECGDETIVRGPERLIVRAA